MSGLAKSSARLWTGLAVLVVAGLVAAALLARGGSHVRATGELAGNPYLDPGTPLSGPAPNFTLTDQFGHPDSLAAHRGTVVLLAFNDSQCTTICPLTTEAMVEARTLLGSGGNRVALLGVNANPNATSVRDVRAYSRAHGMLQQWHFLTGPRAALERVWAAYHIQAAIEQGQVDHTPALFVIDPRGHLRRVYMTQQAYSTVGQLGQLLAQEAAGLLPDHPRVRSALSYAQIPAIAPGTTVTLPRAGGGSVALGPSRRPRLYLFFATWAQQTLDLGVQLRELGHYATGARASGLPEPVAVDESSVEPVPNPLAGFLRRLPTPLSVPVAVDASGRVADGYEVHDQPWFVLVSGSGRFLWYRDVSTAGTLSAGELARQVRAALARAPSVPAPGASAPELAGSPAPLAALHAQSGRLLGTMSELRTRLRALHGYPIVLNIWGSWCPACVAEFPLFASASLRYGRQVAFLGVDANDEATQAQAFLAKHAVGYPSYQSPQASQLQAILPQGVLGFPTTVYLNAAGRTVSVHTGQYEAQGSLDGDIEQYTLRH